MRNSFVLSILERVTEPGRPPCSAWIAWLRRNLSSMNEGSLWDAGRMPTRERNGLEDPPKCPESVLRLSSIRQRRVGSPASGRAFTNFVQPTRPGEAWNRGTWRPARAASGGSPTERTPCAAAGNGHPGFTKKSL